MELNYRLDDFGYEDLDSVREKLSEEQIEGFRVDFALFDDDADGIITDEEAVRGLRACGLCMSHKQLLTALNQLAPRRRNRVTFSQFLTILALNLKPKTVSEEANELRQAFMVFDREKTGFLSTSELRNVITNLGENMTPQEADHMVKDADHKGEGFININDFVDRLCSGTKRS